MKVKIKRYKRKQSGREFFRVVQIRGWFKSNIVLFKTDNIKTAERFVELKCND